MVATVKFSQLPNLTTIQANTTIPVVDGGINYTVTSANLQTFVNGGSGNITSNNITATGIVQGATVSATGNIAGGNLNITGGIVDSVGNLQITSAGNINLTPTTYVNVTGNISATGNITGSYLFGNGSQLTGIAPGYGNANVAAFLPTYSGNIANLTITGTTTLNRYVETTAASVNTGSSFTPAISNGPVQKITANVSFTLNAPSGMTTGQSITLIITQPGAGGAVMTSNAVYKFAYGYSALSVTPAAIDMLSIFYDGTNYLCNLVKGYA
jgi:hypothetical protein